jgi:bla regulator protein BlaR1
LEHIFAWLLTASWQASVLALLVLFTQCLLGARLNPRWRSALWLLVLLRLILPALPESAFSLFQFAPPAPPAFTDSVTEPLFVPASTPPVPAVPAAEIPAPVHPFSAFTLLTLLWLTGAIVLLVLTLEANRRFSRHNANSPAITDPEILQSFADARAELNIRRSIRLIENSQITSPAIMGLFAPTLLLPAHVRDKFDPRELRLIFLHELAHLQRGDLLVQALIALLQILHWFNPVLWYAFRRIRIDREPATDALVLSRAGEAEKERYGLMLIKLLEHFNQRHSLPTLVGILEDQDQFKRRFTLIAQFTRRAYAWSLLGVLLIALLAITCLTKSKATEITTTPNAAKNASNSNAEIQTSANRALPVDLTGAVTLRQAIDWDRADFAKNLLDSGTTPTQSDFTFALTATRPKIVKLFWDHGTHGCSPLSFAISQGASAADVEAMLNAGAKVEPDEETDLSPLTIACSFGNTPAASVLLAHGANPNSIGPSREPLSSPLYMAIGRRQPEIAQLLLNHGAIPRGAEVDVALIDLSAEMKARAPDVFYQKAAACFRLLVAHGALEKVPPQLKPSLLWNACLQVQDPDIVKTLLAHGFRPTDSDGFGNTALSRVRDAVEGKNNWPASPQFQPLLDLLETAAHPGHTGVSTPAIAPSLTLTTRTFLVPAGFFKATTADYDNVQAELIAHGVTFPADAAAIYLPGPHKIVVRNTAEQLDKIQALLTPPPDPASAQVQLDLKVLEIPDTVYAANQTKIDNAVDHADIGQFNNLQGVSLLSTPSVTTKVSLRANIDIVREFPYATAYEPGKYLPNSTLPTQGGGTTNVTLVIPPTPSQFTSKDVGISAELTPSIEDRTSRDPGKIVLAGRVSVADFVGFTKSNLVDSATPSFNTSESQFLEALDDHQIKGIWIPGQHAANNGDPARYLLFVTANVVK